MHETTPPAEAGRSDHAIAWPRAIHEALADFGVSQVAFVPDGGHAELIRRVEADSTMRAVPLTTEEEGVAHLAGAWLGGARAVLLMQSSGVGNTINMLSLIKSCRFPFLALVTMRGEFGEFNPWQVPMGSASAAALALMDVQSLHVEHAADVEPTVRAALRMAFEGGSAVAVLLGQRLVGAKVFER